MHTYVFKYCYYCSLLYRSVSARKGRRAVEGNKVTTFLNTTSYSKSTNHAVVLRDYLEFSPLADQLKMCVYACVHVYRNASSKNVRSSWIVFYCIFHQATRSMLSNRSDKIYFALLLPSRTDSHPYISDAYQLPCLSLCLIYKEFNVNLSCLRHIEQPTTSILHLTYTLMC